MADSVSQKPGYTVLNYGLYPISGTNSYRAIANVRLDGFHQATLRSVELGSIERLEELKERKEKIVGRINNDLELEIRKCIIADPKTAEYLKKYKKGFIDEVRGAP